jgi:hypothetical protein
MKCDVHEAGSIELYFYGELPPAERVHVQGHLKHCAECRRALDDLSIIRAALISRGDTATPPGGDWSGFMARLNTATRVISGLDEARGETGGIRAAAPLRGTLVRYLALAALLGLVTIAVAVALSTAKQRQVIREIAVAEDQPRSPQDAEQPSFDPAFMALSGEHFERSKLVVLGLATKDANAEHSWRYERDLAATLLGDTRLYRQAADERGMNTVAGVMRDLELVLLQTSMSEESDHESLAQLQRLIRRRDLVTKLNLEYGARPAGYSVVERPTGHGGSRQP